MESDGSLSHSQKPAIEPYPELQESSPQLSIPNVLFQLKFCMHFFISHVSYMPHPSQPARLAPLTTFAEN